MRCDICRKNEAGIRFAEIHRGTLKVRSICDDCARATGIADQLDRTVVSLGEAVGGKMASLLRHSAGETECPGCGMTIDEFRRHGHLGCERCIEAFAAVLAPLLERLDHPDGPSGAAAADAQERQRVQHRRQALAQRLQEALASEEYELAARLRDELQELETAAAEHAGQGSQTTSSAQNS